MNRELILVAGLAGLLGCGGGGGGTTPATTVTSNPVPTLTALSPSTLQAGSAAQTLTLTGTNFLATSTVTYNGVSHAATYLSATQLSIALTASDLAEQSSYPADMPVAVTNPTPGGGVSNTSNLTLTAPNAVPTLTSLSPSLVTQGAAAQTLTLTGTSFVQGSTVTYNGVAHTATYVSATELTIQLTADDQATVGSFPVVVTNPAPGGGASSALDLVVQTNQNPAPTLSVLSPSQAVPGAAAQTLVISGANFVQGCTVTYNGVAHTATYVSATKLTIQLTAADQATAGTYPVIVTNPTPGGGASSAVNFTVAVPSTSITYFGGTPSSIVSGETTTLAWEVVNATSVTLTAADGEFLGVSSLDIRPKDTATYTLTATGPGGTVTATATVTVTASTGSASWYAPGNYNPMVAGYFADGTLKKFGDTYYLYPTTDAIYEAGGELSVWVSKDCVNWYNLRMDPNTGCEQWWAPDVIQSGSKYYLYHGNSDCAIFGASADTPVGPWTDLKTSGTPVLPNFNGSTNSFYADINKVITLDGQTLQDDDGSTYMFFCTWASNAGSGCGWVKLNDTLDADIKLAADHGMIPNTEATNVFEGPFPLKRNGTYYLMYSSGDCHTDSYAVQYSTAATATGTYTFGKKVLGTNADGTVHGPGHHSVYTENGTSYIVYHRHNNPHDQGGMSRQECMDVMTFDDTVNPPAINVVTPTHAGIGYLGDTANQDKTPNLCLGMTATASSYFKDTARSWSYLPRFAVDDNNATLWKAGDSYMGHWLMVDLGSSQAIARTMIQFEFPIYYYQYLLEYSVDGTTWSTYADRRANLKPGSPMVDVKDVTARYLRVTVTGVEKPGMMAAIWNIKAYSTIGSFSVVENEDSSTAVASSNRGNLLVDLESADLADGSLSTWANAGSLGGSFTKDTGTAPTVEVVSGRKAVTFVAGRLKSSFAVPSTLTWRSPWTSVAWLYNPTVDTAECYAAWGARNTKTACCQMMYCKGGGSWSAGAHWDYADFAFSTIPSAKKWHQVAMVFDGVVEKVYVDGVLDNQRNNPLTVIATSAIFVGNNSESGEPYSGSIGSLRIYDVALDGSAIKALYTGQEPDLPQAPE